MTNPYKKTNIKLCDVCGNEIKIDQFGNGECKNCGWHNDNPDYTEKANYPNFLSIADAKIAYSQGKKLYHTFELFLDIMKRGFEMSFRYKNKKYGVTIRIFPLEIGRRISRV